MDDGFTWYVPEQFNFTRDVVEQLAADRHRTALTFVDRHGIVERITFAQLALDAARWAHLLRTEYADPGDRVLVLAQDVRAWPAIVLGALKSGLVAVPCPDEVAAAEANLNAAVVLIYKALGGGWEAAPSPTA